MYNANADLMEQNKKLQEQVEVLEKILKSKFA